MNQAQLFRVPLDSKLALRRELMKQHHELTKRLLQLDIEIIELSRKRSRHENV